MKVLWVSDSIDVATGYGTQGRLFAERLERHGHEFVFAAQYSQDKTVINVTVNDQKRPCYGFGRGKFLYAEAIQEICKLENPDLIITFVDWQMCENMIALSNTPWFSRWVCYAPIDGNMLTPRWNQIIHQIPYMVFMTQAYGQDCVKNRRFGYSAYAPLMVRPDIFHPLPADEVCKFKKASRKTIHWDDDDFVVLTVARNQWRKNYPEIIKAAAIIRSEHPGKKIKFVFHCKPAEPFGWDIPKLLDVHGVHGMVAISDKEIRGEDMNRMYNTVDLTVLPSMGEGFGIPIVESFMAGIPCISTADTASRDLLDTITNGDEAHYFPYMQYWQNGVTIPRPLVTADDIVKGILVWYERKQKMGAGYFPNRDKCRNIAVENYAPVPVVAKWLDILEEAKSIYDMRMGKGIYYGGKAWV